MDTIKLILVIILILLIITACIVGWIYWINMWIDGTFKIRCAIIAWFVLVGIQVCRFDKDSK